MPKAISNKGGNPAFKKGMPPPLGAGRPKGSKNIFCTNEFRELCRLEADECMRRLKFWRDKTAIKCASASLRATELILAYGFGKPTVVVSGPNDGPIQVEEKSVDLSKLSKEQKLSLLDIVDTITQSRFDDIDEDE